MGLYRLYEDRDIRPMNVVTIGFGIKTPTGSSTERRADGTLIHAHMQPGTGSWDPLLSLIYTKVIIPSCSRRMRPISLPPGTGRGISSVIPLPWM